MSLHTLLARISRRPGPLPGWIALGSLLASGCALTDDHIELDYEPSRNAGVSTIHASAAETGELILLPFEDRRGLGTRIGEVRNGLHMRTADIRTEQPLPDWVAGALQAELELAGFRVDGPGVPDAEPGAIPSPALVAAGAGELPVVSGVIERVFYSPLNPWGAEVSVVIEVWFKERRQIHRRYEGLAEVRAPRESGEGEGDDGPVRAALARALRHALVEFVSDLDTVLHRAR